MRRRAPREFLVIGLGRFGSHLARELVALGHEVYGVDVDEGLVNLFAEDLSTVETLDATNVRALQRLRVRDFDVCVVASSSSLGDAIQITMNLLELGARHIVGKASSVQHARILERLGVHEVVFPERDMGVRIAHTLASPRIAELFQLTPEVSVVEVAPPPLTYDKTLGELHLRRRFGITVVGIRTGDEINANPSAETLIRPGDLLVVLGDENAIEEFAET